MSQFIEKEWEKGSVTANRYGKANNKYVKNNDENKPSKYLTYLDANILYVWAMSQFTELLVVVHGWQKINYINNIDLPINQKRIILEVYKGILRNNMTYVRNIH